MIFMPLKQTLLPLTFLLAVGWVGPASAEPGGPGSYEHRFSNSERKRLRGDLERFSREQPPRGDIEKRRQVLRERAKQRFHDADTNSNGLLDREELTRLNPNAARNFDEIDHDRNGELSEQEVAQAMRQRMRLHDLRSMQPRPNRMPNR